MPDKDYYKVLGVPRTATADDIKGAFRKLMLKYHPDRDPSPEAAQKAVGINEAYKVLSDPAKRKEYDGGGAAARPKAARPGPAGAAGRARGARAPAGGVVFNASGGGVADILGGMRAQAVRNVSPGAAAAAQARAGGAKKQGEVELWLTPEEALKGTLKTLNIDGQPVTIRVPPGQRDRSVLPLVVRVRVGV